MQISHEWHIAPASPVAGPAYSTEWSPPIDARLLTVQCLGNAPFAILLLEEFEKTARERMSAIEDAFGRFNFQEVSQISHALAGVAAILVAERLSDLACRLQHSAEDQNPSLTQDLVRQLRIETDRVLHYIPEIRALAEQAPDAASASSTT